MTDEHRENIETTSVITEGFEEIENPKHLETANALVEHLRKPNALIRLIKGFLRCVDPRDKATIADRYESQYQEGNIARPGADFGYIMVLLAANEYLIQEEAKSYGRIRYERLTPEQIVVIVQDWKRSLNQPFIIHGDDHARGEKIGCGHIDNAANDQYANAYGLSSSQDMSRALNYLLSAIQDKPSILIGPHTEDAVTIVDSDEVTIPSTITDKTGRKLKFFRYDREADRKNLELLLNFLKVTGCKIGQVIDLDTFIQLSDKQLMTTLGILAHGLPIFEVGLRLRTTRGQRKIKYTGTVPQLNQ